MTNAGLDTALSFLAGICPAQEQTPDLINAWRVKLDRFTDEQVMKALWALSEQPRLRVDVGEVYYRAKTIANREAIDEAAHRRELEQRQLPAGDTRWDRLSDDERAPYIDQALEAWHGFATRRDSPLVVGMARHFANGGSLTPPDPTPAGRCRCGGRLMLDDRATMTAKCDRCHCDFILEAA